jgi:hypothetical protein
MGGVGFGVGLGVRGELVGDVFGAVFFKVNNVPKPVEPYGVTWYGFIIAVVKFFPIQVLMVNREVKFIVLGARRWRCAGVARVIIHDLGIGIVWVEIQGDGIGNLAAVVVITHPYVIYIPFVIVTCGIEDVCCLRDLAEL